MSQPTTTPAGEPADRLSIRGMRYGEILLVYPDADGLRGEVWGTQGVNLCPAEEWEAIDPEAVRNEYGAFAIKMNGPRYKVIDFSKGGQLPDSERRSYGTLEMQLLATVEVDGVQAPYQPVSVKRQNTWLLYEGSEIYELTDPEGAVWVMQAYAQIVDPDLNEADLPGLGDRLELPRGWSFSSRVLEEDLDIPAKEGIATVTQDELQNTYQRLESTVGH